MHEGTSPLYLLNQQQDNFTLTHQHQWHQLTSCPPVGEESNTHSLKASEHSLFVWNNHPNSSRKVLEHSTPLQPVFNIKLLRKITPNVTAHGSAHPYFMFSLSLVVGYSIQCIIGLLDPAKQQLSVPTCPTITLIYPTLQSTSRLSEHIKLFKVDILLMLKWWVLNKKNLKVIQNIIQIDKPQNFPSNTQAWSQES